MKEVRIIESPKELSEATLKELITRHQREFATEAVTYLREICSDHLDELAEAFSKQGVQLSSPYISVNENNCLCDISVTLDKSSMLMTPSEIKHMLNKIITDSDKTFFDDELTSAYSAYRNDPLPVFIKRLFDSLAAEASYWLFNMTHNAQFIYDYVTGNCTSPYFACEDIWFCHRDITEDGTIIKVYE